MKSEWKKVLFQWVCPIIVLFFILGLLFSRFSKTVNAGIASNFERNMEYQVELCASKLGQEFEKSIQLGK